MDFSVLWAQWSELWTYQPQNPILFSSGSFLVLFVLFWGVYLLIYNQVSARIWYLTAFSLFFYYKSSGEFLALFAATIVFNYAAGLWLERIEKWKGKLLAGLIVVNLLPLFYYKYANFWVDNFNALGGNWLRVENLILPVGISFFTFQTISYLVDIYRREVKACTNLLDFGFYLSFFPQLVAGPIVRASDFIAQIRRPIRFETHGETVEDKSAINYISNEELGAALFLIVKGFIKKAIIANYVAQYADLIYGTKIGEAAVLNYSGFENLMAMYAYTLQIYCDFSGYSDMAIGLSMLLGFKLLANFNSPYQSLSITEFWRRWHISLSFWLRDYIYIALGGNRKGEIWRNIFLMTTMLVGGFWHGASWKFVFWGAMHGLGLIGHKWWANQFKEATWRKSGWWRVVAWFLTFHLVAFLWIFFRALSFEDAFNSIYQIWVSMDLAFFAPFVSARPLLVCLLGMGFYTHFVANEDKKRLQSFLHSLPFGGKLIILLMIIQISMQLQTADVQPFIYFQF